ncbi:Hypothetical predicted protein [Paramuricea clavata]|uniref:Uncharacterized protein n=1 Tax=Paramuricea clavata TaxID=317549 RepID=A0A7D9K104_PARCT|nr:Hypothetical predicted protein [Paramuricea clavata]
MEVSDVAVTDNKDGSYTISFCPGRGGMLKFEVFISGMPAPNCSLTKQVNWVISNSHGKGAITDGGFTMRGEGGEGEYCWRVGGCCFDSGVHTWKVRLYDYSDGYHNRNYHKGGHTSSEVGIIDYDEINADIVQSEKKWVYKLSVGLGSSEDISLTLDMQKRTLNVKRGNLTYGGKNYQFTARRVSPFFACSSPYIDISLVE